MTFLPNLFNDSSVLIPEQVQGPSGGRGRGRVVHTYVHLKEFWDYFDTDGDNMVTRHDVRRGEPRDEEEQWTVLFSRSALKL